MFRRDRWVALLILVGACYSPNNPPLGSGDDGAPNDEATAMNDASSGPASTTAPDALSTGPSAATSTGSSSESGERSETTSETSQGSTESTTADDERDCVGIASRTLWISFDGGTLEEGLVENAPANITADPWQVGTWQSYDDPDVDELFELVRGHYAPYDLCLTREQPNIADYDLVLVSSETYEDNPNNPGYAEVDCGDVHTNNTAVVFLSAEANLPTTTKAIAVSKLLAKLYGLEPVVGVDDLMNTPIGNTLNSATFTDECLPKAYESSFCSATRGCGSDQHNSHALLAEAIGIVP